MPHQGLGLHMPFQAEVLRVFIASPSDLPEERVIACSAIDEWNALNASDEGVVLLPVKWETHATPETGGRPQEAINRQLVDDADMLVGMFWTKIGTSTGVAASGTVEEIDACVAAGKPTMLYFSSRHIDPNKIDLAQHAALREFKVETYERALCGAFANEDQLKACLLRDLTRQVRVRKRRRGTRRGNKLEETERLVEMMASFRKAKITPAEFHQFKDELLSPTKAKSGPNAPIKPGQTGPNGGRLEYLKNGDLVEWVPDDDIEGIGEWAMVLRRNDNDILKKAREFETVIWYDRKLVLVENIDAGNERPSTPEIHQGMLDAMARAERKYGKRKIRQYYTDDFGWGMLNGKLSALRWVLGDEWDNLDT